jgi:hypothetical protein
MHYAMGLTMITDLALGSDGSLCTLQHASGIPGVPFPFAGGRDQEGAAGGRCVVDGCRRRSAAPNRPDRRSEWRALRRGQKSLCGQRDGATDRALAERGGRRAPTLVYKSDQRSCLGVGLSAPDDLVRVQPGPDGRYDRQGRRMPGSSSRGGAQRAESVPQRDLQGRWLDLVGHERHSWSPRFDRTGTPAR